MGEVRGDIELRDGVLVIRRIHVHYRLQADRGRQDVVERVHAFHARHCPVYRSLEAAIEITTSYKLAEPGDDRGAGR